MLKMNKNIIQSSSFKHSQMSYVIVVKAFAHSCDGDSQIFDWHNILIVRLISKHVGHAIDGECNIQRRAETTHEASPEGHPKTLVPIVKRHNYWETNG
jgi:hypothetical protein